MSLTHREDSITGIRLREAQQTKIATSATLVDGSIVLELPEGGVCNGTMVKFRSPCNCKDVTGGLVIDGTTFIVVDAANVPVTGYGGIWISNAKIAVILDCDRGLAYLQNAVSTQTHTLLDAHIQNKDNPHSVTAPQVLTSDECATMLDILEAPNVDEGLKCLWRLFDMLNRRFIGSDGKYTWNTYKQGVTAQGTADISGDKTYHDYGSNDASSTTKFRISDTVTITDGVIKLVNPQDYYISTSESKVSGSAGTGGIPYFGTDASGNGGSRNPTDLYNKYISYGGAVYLFTTSSYATGEWYRHGDNGGIQQEVAYVVLHDLGVCVIAKTFVGNVASEDENAYPDQDWVGDTYYVKNDIELGLPKIVSGSYTGQGTFGAASKNGLSFPFVPELVIIQSETTDKSVTLLHGCTVSGGLSVAWNDSTKSVSWYHSSGAAEQMNASIKYRYFAIGKGVWE